MTNNLFLVLVLAIPLSSTAIPSLFININDKERKATIPGKTLFVWVLALTYSLVILYLVTFHFYIDVLWPDNLHSISLMVPFVPAAYPLYIERKQKANTMERAITPMPTFPEDGWMLPSPIYGALMGLLSSTGCQIIPGRHSYMYPEDWRVRFASTDKDFLLWLQAYFSPWIFYTAESTFPKLQDPKKNTWQLNSSATGVVVGIIHEHWNQVGIHFLPDHFEQYFEWTTLAFWAMRNGRRSGNYLEITAPKLNAVEKDRLINVLASKLSLQATLMKNGVTLRIANLPDWKMHLTPHFYEPQLVRLATRAEKYK